MGTAILRNCLKVPITRIFFFRKKFGLSYTKASSDRRKVSKYLTLSFLGPKVLLFCLKSVQWTGNELAGDDEENCENS